MQKYLECDTRAGLVKTMYRLAMGLYENSV